MNCFLIVTGIPASGKSALALSLAEALSMPLLDKDRFLETLLESSNLHDETRRRALSRQADEELRESALCTASAILVSWWKHPRSASESGTPTEWLSSLPGVRIEIHCACSPSVAAVRFLSRKRHPGHLDHRWSYEALLEDFRAHASLGSLGIGPLIEVNTEYAVDLSAVLSRIALAAPEARDFTRRSAPAVINRSRQRRYRLAELANVPQFARELVTRALDSLAEKFDAVEESTTDAIAKMAKTWKKMSEEERQQVIAGFVAAASATAVAIPMTMAAAKKRRARRAAEAKSAATKDDKPSAKVKKEKKDKKDKKDKKKKKKEKKSR